MILGANLRKVVFVASHLYSGSEEVINVLNNHPRVDIKQTNTRYMNFDDWKNLVDGPHKSPSVAAIYGDHLLHNVQLGSKWFYKVSKFIYVFHSPIFSVNQMLGKWDETMALNYYSFRLRRMFEMARKTQGFMISDHEDPDISALEKFLEIKGLGKISLPNIRLNNNLSKAATNRAENIYNNYFFKFNKLFSIGSASSVHS